MNYIDQFYYSGENSLLSKKGGPLVDGLDH